MELTILSFVSMLTHLVETGGPPAYPTQPCAASHPEEYDFGYKDQVLGNPKDAMFEGPRKRRPEG